LIAFLSGGRTLDRLGTRGHVDGGWWLVAPREMGGGRRTFWDGNSKGAVDTRQRQW
jgi:hypothetical protein